MLCSLYFVKALGGGVGGLIFFIGCCCWLDSVWGLICHATWLLYWLWWRNINSFIFLSIFLSYRVFTTTKIWDETPCRIIHSNWSFLNKKMMTSWPLNHACLNIEKCFVTLFGYDSLSICILAIILAFPLYCYTTHKSSNCCLIFL